jgi:ubiquinone/menaquinone biosynthesis C-methylase UbiE
MSRATQSELLEQRIVENKSSQQIDLTTWIFERVRVLPGDRVLELCCGTGAQTLRLLDLVGEGGQVTAVDISKSALETLSSKARSAKGKLACVEANLDSFSSALTGEDQGHSSFDLVFCAYGLYYSSDAEKTLDAARDHLKPGGRIAVVGPFGPNNSRLFDLVRASGVAIGEAVRFSSESFIPQVVIPWGSRHFETLTLHTMVNPVTWTSPERVLNYWQNTTFYDPEKRNNFEKLLQAHFEDSPTFVNEKWVMLVEMSHGR